MEVPYLNRYKNGEYLQYMKDVLQLLTDASIEALDPQKAVLAPPVNAIDQAFKQSQGSSLTQEIMTLDEQRDRAIIGLKMCTEAYTYHYNDGIQAAATALQNNFTSHGNSIQQLSYQEETAVIDSIVADWEKDTQLAAAVTILNLTRWLAELKTVNAAFATKYLERIEEKAATSSENILELRGEATTAYRSLTEHIQAHVTLNTAPGYAVLQNQISVLAGQYNQVVNNRTNNGTDTAPEADTPPAPPAI